MHLCVFSVGIQIDADFFFRIKTYLTEGPIFQKDLLLVLFFHYTHFILMGNNSHTWFKRGTTHYLQNDMFFMILMRESKVFGNRSYK